MNSTITLIEALDEALDDIEGDFTNQQLLDALEVMKLYPFVCDKNKSVPKYSQTKNKLKKNAKI